MDLCIEPPFLHSDRMDILPTPAMPVAPTARTQVRRVAERGCYDRNVIDGIIDLAWHCHVAFSTAGSVHCIPTACWRELDHLYIHGSNGSRLLKALGDGAQACVCITHLDGLVLARSAFHHSMNYRSVVIYGQFERISDDAKPIALRQFMRRIDADRENEARAPDHNELAATTILRISTAEAAAKIRDGGPKDDEADLALPVWSGVLPMGIQHSDPIRSADCNIEPPGYIQRWESVVKKT
jgi:nitroimidazol reductase NimA-like FMN-containing flavoprotein (pyridoxamine 5'-phosphate oxidase superfamily)